MSEVPSREATAALEAFWRKVDDRVAAERPHCAISGRCCDFPTAGHTLFATEFEANVVRASREIPTPEQPGWCPFYRSRRCELRELRPTGCRVYFCDPEYQRHAMDEIGAWAHRELQAVHERTGVRYRYDEFVHLLAEPDVE